MSTQKELNDFAKAVTFLKQVQPNYQTHMRQFLASYQQLLKMREEAEWALKVVDQQMGTAYADGAKARDDELRQIDTDAIEGELRPLGEFLNELYGG